MWNEFKTEVGLKNTRRLDSVWVKGHATKAHIDRRTTATLNNGGNDAADALASAAKAHRAAPRASTEAAARRHHTALATHIFADLECLPGRRVVLSARSDAEHGQLIGCGLLRDHPSIASSVACNFAHLAT